MRLASRKIRLQNGKEDFKCVDIHLPAGSVIEMEDRKIAVLIDERAPGGRPSPARSEIGFPALGGRSFMNGGYRSKQWGIVDTSPEGIRKAKEETPDWDFCPETGDAIIPSEKSLRKGKNSIEWHQDLTAAREAEAAQKQETINE